MDDTDRPQPTGAPVPVPTGPAEHAAPVPQVGDTRPAPRIGDTRPPAGGATCMRGNAAVAFTGDGDGQGDELLVLGRELAFGHGLPVQLGVGAHHPAELFGELAVRRPQLVGHLVEVRHRGLLWSPGQATGHGDAPPGR